MLLSMVRPKYFVPIHGEYRHLVLHGKLAEQSGIPPENILIMETGDVLELTPDRAELVDSLPESYIVVDGRGVGDMGQTVLEHRGMLASSGFLVVVVTLDKYTNGIVGEPQVVTRGFAHEAELADFVAAAKQEIARVAEWGGTSAEVNDRLQASLARFAYAQMGRRPIVVPVVIRV